MNTLLSFIANHVGATVATALASTLRDRYNRSVVSLHPNGFLIFKVGSIDEWLLRLHVWLPEAPRPDPLWLVHSHTCRLVSYVIMGAIEDIRWGFQPQGWGKTWRYRVRYEGSRSTLEPTGEHGKLDMLSKATISAPSGYTMEADEYHCTVSRLLPAVSVCLMHGHSNQGASVFGPKLTNRSIGSERTLLNAQLRIAAEKAIDSALDRMLDLAD